jgi:two-component system NtrC family sensor kinase
MKSMKSTVERTNEEEVLKILSEQVPVGVCIMQDGKFCYFNSTFPLAIGYTVDELVGKDSLEIVVPEDREMVNENTVKMLEGELHSPYQFRVICKDGSIIWVMATVKSIQYHERRAILGSYMEITERKQMMDALRESEERYRELANSISDVFFAMDEHLRYTYWNKASEILTGIRMEDAIGKSLREIFPDTPGVRRAEKMYRKVLKTQQSQTFVNDYDTDGRHYLFEISAYPSNGGISVFVKDITERKQAEEALEQSEERYRDILEKMEDSYFEVDLGGHLTFVNGAACRHMGYSREELIGMSYKSYTSEDDIESVFRVYNEVYRTGVPNEGFAWRVIRKDGTRGFAETSVSLQRNSKGEIIGFRGVGRNVTERKQAEQKLSESEQKYRLIFENSPDCIAQIDREGRYLAANPATAKSLGVPVEELVGKTLFEVTPQEVAQFRLENMRKVLDEWQPQIFEDERAGRYFHHIVIPIKTSDQKEAIQVITRDVTERKQADEKLRQSEENYKTLFNSSVVGMYVMDAETFKVVMGNRAARELVGFSSAEEGIGVNPFDFVVPEDREKVLEIAINEFLQDSRRTHEIRVMDKDGRIRWQSISIAKIMHKGRLASLVSFTDITERKQMDEKLKESEQKYRLLFETSPDCIAQVDREGRYLAANPATAKSLGVPVEELNGKLVSKMVPKAIAQHRLKMLRKALDEWQPQTFEDERAGRYFHHIIIPIKTSDQKEAVQVITRDITEHKQAADKLQRSNERYRALFDSSVVGTLVVDAETMKVVLGNQAASKIFGFGSIEEGAGVNLLDFVPPKEREKDLNLLKKEVFEQDSRRAFDFQAVTKDGRTIWISATGAKITQGDRLAGLLSFTDITERKRAEEALRQSEEKYRTILEEMEDAYFEVDLGGHLTFVNDATCCDLGYSREELIGKSYKDYTAEEDIESVFRVFNEVYQTGVPNKGFAWKTIRKDGHHGFAETSVSPLRNDKGEIIGFRGIGRDVTERKQAEEKLQQSEENYRALFDSSVTGAFVIDAETIKVVIANQAASEIFGFSSVEEAIGLDPFDLIPPDDREYVLKLIMEELFEQDSRRTFDVRAITKDGREIWISATGARIMHEGRLAGLISFTDITERKKAEEKLRQSRENYRALFDSSVIGALVVDAETMEVVMANQATLKMFGFSSPEDGVNPLDFSPSEDRQRNLELIVKEVFEKDSRGSIDLPVMTKDGRKLWVNVTGARIMHKGKLAGLFSFTDITERKQAEEKLRQSEENYKTLFNSAVIGMYVLDVETMKVVMGNQAAKEIAGFDAVREGLGMNPFDFIVPEDREQALEMTTKEFEQDLRRTHEIRVVAKDGGIVWISTTAARIMHEGKSAALVSFTDITERKQAEEALRQSEANYRVLFDSSVIGTIVLNAETLRAEMLNRAAAEMFGFSSVEEARGVDPLVFIRPDDRERILEVALKALFEEDSREVYELGAVTKDGREIWINATGARIMHGGKLAGLISFTDITEQKKQREHLMMTDRLASLGELASGTAHELNNPLTSIIGFSQLLMEKEVPDDIREDLDLINNEAQRAATVTRNLLTFARKHASMKQLNQINTIIEDVLKLRAYEHKANGIEVGRQLAPDLPEILVDYFQMQQVFMNIIINAEYFMIEEHNKGTLSITTKRQNSTIMISFADDGPGISQENRRRIFDPFFTTKGASKGTGLGLSICHGIVTEHGGQIYVKNQQGKGATIVVELPINSHNHIGDMP